MKVGYQGIPGSYSETVVQSQYKATEELDVVGYSNFLSLVSDLVSKKLDCAVIPVENSTTGLIARSVDLFRYQPIVATAEHYESVQHTLWGLPGSELSTIQTVYSHPEALSQCDHFFKVHPYLEAKAYEDTAKAALFIKEKMDLNQAAIASPRAGKLYGLKELKSQIQTENNNTTRFYMMKHKDNAVLTGNQLSLYAETRHESGALSKLLQVFNLFDCNLLALNARPISGKSFVYGFFIELNIASMQVPLEILWQTLQQVSEYVQLLGQFDAEIKKEG